MESALNLFQSEAESDETDWFACFFPTWPRKSLQHHKFQKSFSCEPRKLPVKMRRYTLSEAHFLLIRSKTHQKKKCRKPAWIQGFSALCWRSGWDSVAPAGLGGARSGVPPARHSTRALRIPSYQKNKGHDVPLFFWRSGWDSNPRGIAPKLISSQPRYDRFDTAPSILCPRRLCGAFFIVSRKKGFCNTFFKNVRN